MDKKLYRQKAMVEFVGCILLVLGVACFFLLILSSTEKFQIWYTKILHELVLIEYRVTSIDKKWIFAIVVLLLFALRSVVPLFTLSTLCVITSVVLPHHAALIINFVGISILLTIKYEVGKRISGGNAWRIVKINDDIRKLFEQKGTGNPWILLVSRIVPAFPFNAVSQIYGTMNFEYKRFLVISLLGFAPRLVSYTLIGSNAFDPFSASFLLPLIIVLLLSGISLLGLGGIIRFIVRIKNK